MICTYVYGLADTPVEQIIGDVVGGIEEGVNEGAKAVAEGVKESVGFVVKHPVIIAAAGCIVGNAVACVGAITISYG